MRSPISRPRKKHLVAVAFLLVAGCGGKVIFEGASTGGGAGTGSGTGTSTGTGATDCVIGVCGDTCTKCINGACFTGRCDKALKCQPPATPVSCL